MTWGTAYYLMLDGGWIVALLVACLLWWLLDHCHALERRINYLANEANIQDLEARHERLVEALFNVYNESYREKGWDGDEALEQARRDVNKVLKGLGKG